MMFGVKDYYYLIDDLDRDKAVYIRKALGALNAVKEITFHFNHGIIQVAAKKNIEQHVLEACRLSGCGFRRAVKKSEI